MARLILHPFRLGASGAVVTAEQGNDDEVTSQLAVHIGTRIGEREMVWSFGTPDPVFTSGPTAADVQVSVSRYGPDRVAITAVTATVDGHTTKTLVTWERK